MQFVYRVLEATVAYATLKKRKKKGGNSDKAGKKSTKIVMHFV